MYDGYAVSTHSRPKAAGYPDLFNEEHTRVSTHSRPKAAGPKQKYELAKLLFQHTAARRRLGKRLIQLS